MDQNSEAHVPTTHGSSYLKQLCRHWGHKFPVTFDDSQGRIELPKGVCVLQASPESLKVILTTFAGEDEARLQQVVAEHLQRFGFREQLVFNWQPQPASATA